MDLEPTIGFPSVTLLIQWLRSGGAEKQVLLTATALARRGVRCRIVTLSFTASHPRIEALIGSVQRLGIEVVRPSAWMQRSGLHWFCLWFGQVMGGESVLWTWGIRADLLGKMVALFNRKLRLICSLRSASEQRVRAERCFHHLLHRRVAAYIANSRKGCEILRREIPASRAPAYVVYNALSDDEFEFDTVCLPDAAPNPIKVVVLGNLRFHVKGYDTILEMAQLARIRNVPIDVHVAGRGDDLELFVQERARLGLITAVQYHGEVSNPFEFLRQGNVFVLASRVEGMPNALLEAMSLGLPCISTPVGDVGFFAEDRRHLRVVPFGDAEAILGVLEEFRKDWDEARQLGKRGMEHCRRRFTVEALGRALLPIFVPDLGPVAPDSVLTPDS